MTSEFGKWPAATAAGCAAVSPLTTQRCWPSLLSFLRHFDTAIRYAEDSASSAPCSAPGLPPGVEAPSSLCGLVAAVRLPMGFRAGLTCARGATVPVAAITGPAKPHRHRAAVAEESSMTVQVVHAKTLHARSRATMMLKGTEAAEPESRAFW